MSEWSGTSRAIVDLAAVRHNVVALAARAPAAEFMAVVKADAYGHGLVPVARAAVDAGAGWLGVAQLDEALTLRAAFDAAGVPRPGAHIGSPGGAGSRVFTWTYTPGAPLARAVAAGVDLSVSATWAMAEAARAGRSAGRPARVHLKIDTGMGRLGARPEQWHELVAAARAAQEAGEVSVVGVWSHLACADDLASPATAQQSEAFAAALAVARDAGLRPLAHLAASSGILWHPGTHHNLIRAGIAMYGISPNPEVASATELGLRPVMRWEADLALVKHVPAHTPISYGWTEAVERDTWVGVVPVGYADGVPRHASGAGPLSVGGRPTRVLGRVCMDQVMVDLGPGGPDGAAPAAPGVPAVLLAGDDGDGPSAEDWASAAGTIGYEIVTRVGPRVPRSYVGAQPAQLRLHAPDADATRALGRALAGVLRGGDLVVLGGELGAGKTTFTQGLGQGLGVRGQVASPTFVIARVHPALGQGPDLVHVDAYRLGSLDEVNALDLDTSLEDSVTVVEWGTGKVEVLAADRLEVELVRPRGGASEMPAGDVHPVEVDLDGVQSGAIDPDRAATPVPFDASTWGDEAPREVVVRPVGRRWAGVDLATALEAG